MPKVFTSDSQKIGELGENIAVKFLMKHGFAILDRNYTKRYGEIDIVAEKDNKIYFVEVKAISRLNLAVKELDDYRAEDNMHPWKLKRLSRVIQAYLLGHSKYEDKEWQVDLVVVFLDLQNKKARVKVESDIIL
ncbi:hypothetical protein A2914_02935 [Candidatus Nomurabacteria bacterium RIFCSPLOWO2_01_FULL_41_21]|uniref:UPF0102 protein A2733_00930 n=2 Tax=Candidatus Nomuraibacteriota TaxID=1752729 RepID=A0A1F6V3W3_9BACT|nr:MAG: hypothetical protein A2733_00930 [Candidatus Nomurabacteria bacterium RIFCSPHIGHO2_01_FULL_40_20]OGI88885.1 MAG: hypothetical protein A2914_02935 [Candidatus Nomurabacteria bacterium RIFCSPLOWO2_01_FULL_41_21]